MPRLKVTARSNSPFGDIDDAQHKFVIKVGTGLKGEKGDKGDRGLQGARGLQGIQGVQGLKGETGQQGIQGLKGDKGDTGLKGDKGDTGLKGDKGDRGDTGLINGATQVQVDNTTKVMYNGSSIPANTAASRLVGTSNGQIPLAQDLSKALYTPTQTTGVLTSTTDNLNIQEAGNVFYVNHRPIGSGDELGFGRFWTELYHQTAPRVQFHRSVNSVFKNYARMEAGVNTNIYGNWVKYAFHGEDYTATSVKSGAASYKRGWRKLTASFGSGASTITRAHGVSNIAGVTVRATVSGVSYYANDARATHRFTIQTDGTNVIITKSADATALNGAALTIYIDEEL